MLFLLDGHVCLAKLSVLIFGILVLESEVLSLKATGRVKREGKNHFPISSLPKPENVTKRTGKSVKLRLKAILASGTGHWTKNYEPVEQSKSVVIGNNANVSWLRIKNLHTSDSGLYAFTVNHTIMKQWRLHVTKENRKDPPGIEHPCGKADPDLGSDCLPFSQTSHPNCTSFPGRPFNVTVHYLIYKGNLYVQAQWKPPKQGNNDLWGYQVYISGMIGHPGFANCLQINKKNEQLHVSFNSVKFGSTYRITVQSMPAYHVDDANDVIKKITIPGKCEMLEFRNSTDCCSLANITDHYSDQKIHLSWKMTPRCQQIKEFKITWMNLQKHEMCYGDVRVKNQYNYTIPLSKQCSRFNYSIKISGVIGKDRETRTFRVTVQILPQPSTAKAARILESASDNEHKILIAVVGSVLGLLICALFAIYRRFFQQVLVKLPVPPSLDQSPENERELLPSDTDKKRVFIIHTRCCQWCTRVLHCFGVLLNSTGLIQACIDVWHELEISPNVPRWYEQQIKSADCVIVLFSRKMTLRTLNKVPENLQMDDPLNIKCQLNLVRGEICQQPDTQKFVPAFFTCSGNKKNVPDFLSARWSHKLPKEIDRVIFHLLHVEMIQPYRTQSVVVMGGNGHPFDEKKKELERAVIQAEVYHANLEKNQSL